MEQSKNLTPIKFHFYSLGFTPFKGSNEDHNSILKDVITYISVQKHAGKGHLIDRNQNRPQEERRELFMTSAIIMHRERRIRCSIALLRPGRVPKLKPVDDYKLVPLSSIGTVAEETHFFIDFSRNKSVICVEYNHHGPRISDIEYYLRNVSYQTLRKSKATEVEMFMETSIDDTLRNLKNVLNMDIKIQPKNFVQMDKTLVGKYFTGLNNLGNLVHPKFLKLEALFQTPGRAYTSSEINNEGNKMFLDLLNAFKTRPYNIDCFDNFVVKYEDVEGKEEVFNLLKGKKEVLKEVNLKSIKSSRQWYELIHEEFNEFMSDL
ncbi:hypothetical protein H9Q13_14380 [Pontibacter sp. JH31]|uniref:Uncharacterized protein n=1 Tax=Pontibacter aquaedesilientis TaxID=2766980 RepID=A0ABR7XJ98_9BACT|nr:hypothetical protein [Pontibacter aquaedesilientis]MBD1398355.1 hypothetical protein [Pontibacter aquaedesilientis]